MLIKHLDHRKTLTILQDLEEAFDDEIAALKIRMEQACEADNTARERGQPAIHKLKMLPEVVALLNRNTVQHSIVDPDTNFLQSVKFFLEPLNDGSLPAYNIQRDLFAALSRLPIEKEALLSSGIGKVVLYYTKSKRPEIGIKRTAERLLGEWSRPILKRSDDYKKRKVVTKDYDVAYVFLIMYLLYIYANLRQGCSTRSPPLCLTILAITAVPALFTIPERSRKGACPCACNQK
jgi:hypothetical protein